VDVKPFVDSSHSEIQLRRVVLLALGCECMELAMMNIKLLQEKNKIALLENSVVTGMVDVSTRLTELLV